MGGITPFQRQASVFLLSASVIGLEIALTRVFSALFRTPYVFLLLSCAICGLGLGAILAPPLRRRCPSLADGLCLLAAAWVAGGTMALGVLFGTPLLQHLNLWTEPLVVILLTLLPFAAAGAFLSLVFSAWGEESGALYRADLSGAAGGTLLALGLLQGRGGLEAILWLAVGMGGLAAFWGWRSLGRGAKVLGSLLAPIALLLALGQTWGRWLDVPPLRPGNPNAKTLFAELGDPSLGAKILATEWNAFARTDVVQYPDLAPLYIYTDGEVPAQMFPWQGPEVAWRDLRAFIGFLPFYSRRPRRALCIGPGGGLDVLLAVMGGAQEIDAVEINASMYRLVERYRSFYGDLYRWEPVRALVDEGRHFVRRSRRRYDLIYMALAKTATSETAGLAVVENTLYTVEAFREYWRHLSEEGWLACVLQDYVLADRALLTAVAALEAEGIFRPEASRHVALFSVPPRLFALGPYRKLLLFSRLPIEREEGEKLGRIALALGLLPYYLPNLLAPPPYDLLARPQVPWPQVEEAFSEYHRVGRVRLSLRPVRDEAPFFIDLARGLHPQLLWLLLITAGATALLMAFLAWAWRPDGTSKNLAFLLYFGGLGVGFMFIELALIQKGGLYLGYPTLSLSVVLFALLLGGGWGSGWSQGWPLSTVWRRLRRSLAGLVALSLLGAMGLGALWKATWAWPMALRIPLAMLPILLLGFLMGQPFPTGLRSLPSKRIPAAWAVNGLASVLGSVLAMALAKWVGYSGLLLLGGLVYLGVWAVAGRFQDGE